MISPRKPYSRITEEKKGSWERSKFVVCESKWKKIAQSSQTEIMKEKIRDLEDISHEMNSGSSRRKINR